MPRLIKAKKTTYTVPVWAPHPISVAMALGLGNLYGRGIEGATGRVRYGQPAIGTRTNFTGYAAPEQLFTGWNPGKVAGGAVLTTPGGLPGTQAPAGFISPLLAATMGVGGSRQS